MSQTDQARHNRRFDRQLSRLENRLPSLAGGVRAITAPGRALIRLPLAVLFILGGFVGFLPIVGFWMLPLGLILLAIDLPRLRPGVAALAVRFRVWIRRFRR